MPRIISVSTLEFAHKTGQDKLKTFSKELFGNDFKDIDKLLEVYDNAEIENRNLCVPVDFFYKQKSFSEKNTLYIEKAKEYSIGVIDNCIKSAGLTVNDITDFVFVSSTGISTPSIDAILIDRLKLNPYLNRTPLWGLGCAGGVSGLAKANTIALANKNAVVLLLTVELCSLTFVKNDISKSNIIAAGLFSDGIAGIIISGDEFRVPVKLNYDIEILNSQSRLYYGTLDIMGWEITDPGFKVIFSKDIPTIVNERIKDDIEIFLAKNKLTLDSIKNFIVHPGGKKVIDAYINALQINPDLMKNTKKVLRENGNMSSSTVLYVLDEFTKTGFQEGYGLMMSLGPGFSSEMALLKISLNENTM